ncbi:MAG TPA: glycerophosphodiester phosphodiesterase family protein [Actinomycetales bacterium]|nr:glycerophosphodiester phosphodiesterase family protein [Actinomycetales bacterium]
MNTRQPLPRVLAHRGASETAPEHTIAAYRAALDGGADGLECDVRLTRDGVPVCIHDRRVNRTSNGKGVVSTLQLADLAELDFSVRTARRRIAPRPVPPTVDVDCDGAGVLTLERLLGVVLEHGSDVELAIETKHPTRHGPSVERRVVDLLRRHGLHRAPAPGRPTVRLMSFSALALKRVQLLAPELPTVYLANRLTSQLAGGRLPAGADTVGPSIGALRHSPRYVQRVHRRGRQVYVWTVNTAEDVELCRRAGVDAIITDRPRAVRALLDQGGPMAAEG